MISGIYIITNTLNNKVYIGSSVDILKRKYEHFSMSNKCAKLLLKSFIKNGIDKFTFEILEECDKDLLYNIEQKYLDQYESYNRLKGYNISPIARGSRYNFNSETALKTLNIKRNKGFNKNTYPKLSISKIGKLNPMFGKCGKNSSTSKKVASYSISGELLKEFDSCVDASKYYNIPRRSISRVASGERLKTHSLIFKYIK